MLGLEDRDIFFNEKVEELVELPKDAKFILNAGWMASPVSNWEIAYHISKKGGYWILWGQSFDENLWDYVIEELLKCKVVSKNNITDAIKELVVKNWTIECSNGLDFGPDYIMEYDIIDEETINQMIEEVWSKIE